ncbi:hypothetical protein APY03_7798 [Variovorax sp. WDL1]|nr:hypothetical protein APY03_7798 [Variovorax sp. WDL1]
MRRFLHPVANTAHRGLLVITCQFGKQRGTGFARPLVLPPRGGTRLHEVSRYGGGLNACSRGANG